MGFIDLSNTFKQLFHYFIPLEIVKTRNIIKYENKKNWHCYAKFFTLKYTFFLILEFDYIL